MRPSLQFKDWDVNCGVQLLDFKCLSLLCEINSHQVYSFCFLTWQPTDVCGSSATLLAVHLTRITTAPSQRLSNKCSRRPIHTWLCATEADLGPLNFGLATAWRRPLLEMNGDILWTQQRSSGVRSERKKVCSSSCCL